MWSGLKNALEMFHSFSMARPWSEGPLAAGRSDCVQAAEPNEDPSSATEAALVIAPASPLLSTPIHAHRVRRYDRRATFVAPAPLGPDETFFQDRPTFFLSFARSQPNFRKSFAKFLTFDAIPPPLPPPPSPAGRDGTHELRKTVLSNPCGPSGRSSAYARRHPRRRHRGSEGAIVVVEHDRALDVVPPSFPTGAQKASGACAACGAEAVLWGAAKRRPSAEEADFRAPRPQLSRNFARAARAQLFHKLSRKSRLGLRPSAAPSGTPPRIPKQQSQLTTL